MRQNATKSDRLSAAGERLVVATLTAPTLTGAAQVAGISRATAHRLRRSEAFQARLSEARDETLRDAASRAAGVLVLALDTLRGVLEDETAPTVARISAARTVLTVSPSLIELNTLAERVADLERALQPESKTARPGGAPGKL